MRRWLARHARSVGDEDHPHTADYVSFVSFATLLAAELDGPADPFALAQPAPMAPSEIPGPQRAEPTSAMAEPPPFVSGEDIDVGYPIENLHPEEEEA